MFSRRRFLKHLSIGAFLAAFAVACRSLFSGQVAAMDNGIYIAPSALRDIQDHLDSSPDAPLSDQQIADLIGQIHTRTELQSQGWVADPITGRSDLYNDRVYWDFDSKDDSYAVIRTAMNENGKIYVTGFSSGSTSDFDSHVEDGSLEDIASMLGADYRGVDYSNIPGSRWLPLN